MIYMLKSEALAAVSVNDNVRHVIKNCASNEFFHFHTTSEGQIWGKEPVAEIKCCHWKVHIKYEWCMVIFMKF